MNKELVKVQYAAADGNPAGREYTYFAEEPLALGTRVRVPVKEGRTIEAVVTAVNVPEAEIAAFADKVKTIPVGSIMVQPAPEIPSFKETTDKYFADMASEIPEEKPGDTPAEIEEATEKDIPAAIVTTGTEIGLYPDMAHAFVEATKLLEYAERRLIHSNEDLKPAVEDLGIIAKGTKALLEMKKRALAPLKEKSDAITAAFKQILEPLEIADQLTRRKMESFNNEQKRKAAEAAAIQNEKEALAAREAALSGTGEITVDLTPPQAPPPVPAHTRTEQATQGFQKVTKWEVVDPNLVPRVYLIVDAAKVGKMVRASSGTLSIPGIRIWTEDAVRINTK
ncbi:MAG: hypothetical protein WC329_01730 [Candidatus Omnitrophota bacterium]|jgi:primosomal protein N'